MKFLTIRISLAVLCIILSCLLNKSHAQLHADFSANNLSGCAPLLVRFTDESTGSPLSWRWDLGNGTISTLQNPTATYFNPGSYSIKLVVRNNTGADSVIKQQYITVFPKPVVAFTASDTIGCFPHMIQFTDLSTTIDGTITDWLWDFGDGTTSPLSNPAHTYNIGGNFTVSLRVTNSNGCSAVLTKSGYININGGVIANFSNTSAATCSASPSITFTNLSSGPGSLSYEWLFGDGATSAVTNPQHTYTVPGSYTVSLIVTSPQGCRDTIIKQNLITFGPILSQFVSPDTVCAGASFTFANTSTPTPAVYNWDFGDGTTGTDTLISKIYSTAGTYSIKLVNDFGACKDSATRNIVVIAKPSATFNVDKTSSCQVPFTANFTAIATGSNNYLWNFGDGGTSIQQNPSHTYNSTGEFTVRLIITNSNGCSDTLTRTNYISIKIPVITVAGLPRTGCLPIQINPIATIVSNDPVVSYDWDFGDGSNSAATTPSHTYTLPGTYTVTLTIITASGCKETLTITDAVKAGTKPSANFALNPNDVCASQMVNFTDLSTGSVDQWLWQFGDGGVSTQQNPSYQYTDTGYFNVTLIVWSNTCADTIRYYNIVHIRPPIARFTILYHCSEKYTRQFTDNSIGALSWSWDFGDGTTSDAQHPLHTYTATGNFTVTLTVTNGTCSHTTMDNTLIIDEQAAFTADKTVICRNSAINFTAPSINAGVIRSWEWNFGDGTAIVTTASATNHIYQNAGQYKAILVITDILGCKDTSSVDISVYGATADFSALTPNICLGDGEVQFADQSVTDGVHPIALWKWEYGDGSSESLIAPPFRHLYTTRGNYAVKMTITDQYGCKDSITKNSAVIISKPIAGFHSTDTASCTDKPVSFINTSAGTGMSYEWHFGDGANDSQLNPVHTYTSTGIYTIQLNVQDQYGCTDTLIRPAYISISLPVAAFRVSDSVSSCPPLRVAFTNMAQHSSTVRWDFGDGNTSVLTDPIHNYTLAGIYYALQFVTGPGGCTDTISKRIEVKGPSGTFDYSPKVGCDPLTVTFTAITQNRSSILWDFTDGTTEMTTDSTISHTYATPGDYIPRIILTDAAGCNVPVTGQDTIHVIGIQAGFTMNKASLCDAGVVNFTNQTVSNDYISSWNWQFGDGATSTDQHPQHYYAAPGTYTVSLLAISAEGCADSIALTDTIHVFARPLITIAGDTAACVPATVQFAGQVTRGNAATTSWQWNMGNGQLPTTQAPAPQQYTAAGAYTITAIATDEHNCRDTATKLLTIHPLPSVNAGVDKVLCLGTPVRLEATGAVSYIWESSASLSCTACSNPFANPADNSIFVVKGFNEFGCSLRDTVAVRVRKPFRLLHGPGDTLCLGETYRLTASGADLYIWSPAATLSNSTVSNPLTSPVINTDYQVIGMDNDHCFSDTANIPVKVYPIPTVEAGADQTLAVGSSTQIKAVGSTDVTNYTWTPAYNISCATCKEPFVSPRQTTQYNLEAKNAGGCVAKDALTIFVVCNNGNLFVPNTFSPNGDGMNEYFYPRGKGLAKIKSFRIFNRWGEIVFERQNFDANNASAGWDGTYKGKKLSADVFIYTCDVVCENNEVLSYKGDVTLLR